LRLLSLKQLGTDKGIAYTRAYVLRLMERGQFPRSIHLGPNRVAWLESEIDAWIEARAAARDQDAEAASAAMRQQIAQRHAQRGEWRRGRKRRGAAAATASS